MPASYDYVLRYAEPAAPSTYYYIAASVGRTTLPSDTPANIVIPGGLPPLNFSINLFDGIDPVLSPRGGFGSVVIQDPTGRLDYLADKVMVGGTLTLLRGTPGAAVSTFSSVATMTTSGLLYDEDRKEIRVRDQAWLLESPLHEDRYTGAGGANGMASLTGVLKPYAVGQCFRVPPTLIDATNLIYQVSGTAIESIDRVDDGGAALTASGTDRANYAAMAATAPSAGQFDTCLAEGLFRLGASPVYDITANIKGDKTGGTYVNKRGDIAARIATRAGTVIGSVDSSALSALNTAEADACGYFWNQEITKAEALNEIMQGCLGFWFVNLSGALVLGRLEVPVLATAAKTYSYPAEVGRPSSLEAYEAPRYRTVIGYQRNYFPVDAGRLAGAVSDADKAIAAQDSQYQTYTDSGMKTPWPTAREVKKHGGYYGSSPAATACSREVALFDYISQPSNQWRRRIKVPIFDDPFTLVGYLGQVIAISGYSSRYSWLNPRKAYLIGVDFNGAGLSPTATLWL